MSQLCLIRFHRTWEKLLLTTALIGVNVSCPLAKAHGRPADYKYII
jgi:hypothetical protein